MGARQLNCFLAPSLLLHPSVLVILGKIDDKFLQTTGIVNSTCVPIHCTTSTTQKNTTLLSFGAS